MAKDEPIAKGKNSPEREQRAVLYTMSFPNELLPCPVFLSEKPDDFIIVQNKEELLAALKDGGEPSASKEAWL